jgi:hypothetical protein
MSPVCEVAAELRNRRRFENKSKLEILGIKES